MQRNKSFLIEIGTEEIPVDYIKPALSQLLNSVCEKLATNNLEYEEVATFATPRRLVFKINKLESNTSPNKETIIGPPKKIAFDDFGNLTQAGRGFARKFGVEISDLKECETDKGEYVCIEKKIPSQDTSTLLAKELPDIIKNLHFPKRMKWDNSRISFARPIRWICCFFGADIVKMKVGNVVSDKYSYVRTEGEVKKIEISGINYYFDKLKEMGIFLDHRKRKQYIKSEIEKICSEYGSHMVKIQEELLKEVNFLVQNPYVFLSEFSKEFIVLPREVLLASMSKYQRVFGIENDKGELIPKFIGVADGKPQDLKSVKENYKSVLESRLQDSLFFYKKDSSSPLEEKMKELKGVICHKELGSMYEKMERVEKICDYLATGSSLEENDLKALKRAVFLCKADLQTYMVNEFPSLQGTMGKIYALNDGEGSRVAEAIYEHYLPRFSEDQLPQGEFGTIISVADRIDSLSGYFGLDLAPSGSYDPYGLRRDAYAVIKLIISGNIDVRLDELVWKSIQLFNGEFKKGLRVVKGELLDFIIDKFRNILLDEFGSPDLIDSVLNIDTYNILGTYQKFQELFHIKEEEYFLKAAKVSERTGKIFKDESKIREKVDRTLFEEPLERELWQLYSNIEKKVNELIRQKEYKEVTKLYGDTFYEVIDEFFDKVFVNVNKEDIRENRLALCKKIYQLYNSKVAELSLLENIEVG